MKIKNIARAMQDIEIEKAEKLLRDNGYIVRKITKDMEKDSKECEKMSDNGEDMDCCGCACSVCIMQ